MAKSNFNFLGLVSDSMNDVKKVEPQSTKTKLRSEGILLSFIFLSFLMLISISSLVIGAGVIFDENDVIDLRSPISFTINTDPTAGDGNASSVCSAAEVLLGNNTCMEISPFLAAAGSDTNASTICSGNTVLLGNSTCASATPYEAAGASDTNASTICSGNTVLLGNSTCASAVPYEAAAGTDTNVTTHCTGAEALLGNGTCAVSTAWFDDTTIADTDTNASTICSGNTVLLGNSTCASAAPYEAAGSAGFTTDQNNELNTTGSPSFVNLTVNNVAHIQNFTSTNQLWTVKDDGAGNMIMDFPQVGGSNGLFIETTGTFLEIWGNPGAGNDYEMFSIEETQGDDTAIDFYEGAVGRNEFWTKGSHRIGGFKSSACTNVTGSVDCGENADADLIVADDIWAGGTVNATFFHGDGSLLVNLPSSTDTNASTICSGNTVLLGNSTCASATPYEAAGTDTNVTTHCTGAEALLGNGTCAVSTAWFDDTTIADTDTQKTTSSIYMYNDSATIFFNETQLNSTIDLRASAGGFDGNASSICAGATVLLGNNTCMSIVVFETHTVDTDTNASTICAGATVLLGNSTCASITPFNAAAGSDTNASTICAGNTVLLGNSTCASAAPYEAGAPSLTNVAYVNNTIIWTGVQTWNADVIFRSSNKVTIGDDTTFYINSSANCFGDGQKLETGTDGEVFCGVSVGEADTDTNVTTHCTGGTALLGNGTCAVTNDWFDGGAVASFTNVAYFNNTNTWTQEQTLDQGINITIGKNNTIGNTRTWWNGSCLNTEVGSTLIQSIGCA